MTTPRDALHDAIHGGEPPQCDCADAILTALADEGWVLVPAAPDPAPLDVERLARALHNVSYGCEYPSRPSRSDAIYHKGHAAQIAAEYAKEPQP